MEEQKLSLAWGTSWTTCHALVLRPTWSLTRSWERGVNTHVHADPRSSCRSTGILLMQHGWMLNRVGHTDFSIPGAPPLKKRFAHRHGAGPGLGEHSQQPDLQPGLYAGSRSWKRLTAQNPWRSTEHALSPFNLVLTLLSPFVPEVSLSSWMLLTSRELHCRTIEARRHRSAAKRSYPRPGSGAATESARILQARLQQYVTRELPDVQAGFRKGRGTRLPTSAGSWKKQEISRKTSISALLTMPKPLIVWIIINRGKFFKRWEYQTTWPASWETYMQVRKQQSELDMEQKTGSK